MPVINEEFIKKNIVDENVNIIGGALIAAPEKIVLSKLNCDISSEEVKKITEVFALFRDVPITLGGKQYTRTKSTTNYILAKNDTTAIALFQNNMGMISVAKYLDNTIEPDKILKILQSSILKALI